MEIELLVRFFYLMIVVGQLLRFCFTWGRIFLFVLTFLKTSAGGPNVIFYSIWDVSYCGAVNYLLILTFIFNRASGFRSTIASWPINYIIHIQQRFIGINFMLGTQQYDNLMFFLLIFFCVGGLDQNCYLWVQ